MKIWLDDIREPPELGWTWATNYSQFVYCVRSYADQQRWDMVPMDLISFDHDLGAHSRSGHDCIKWLAAYAQELGPEAYPDRIEVHSANPVGAENIRKYDEWYRRMVSDAS